MVKKNKMKSKNEIIKNRAINSFARFGISSVKIGGKVLKVPKKVVKRK